MVLINSGDEEMVPSSYFTCSMGSLYHFGTIQNKYKWRVSDPPRDPPNASRMQWPVARTAGSRYADKKSHSSVHDLIFQRAPKLSSHVWVMCGSCLGHVWVMSGSCLGHVWVASGACLRHVWAADCKNTAFGSPGGVGPAGRPADPKFFQTSMENNASACARQKSFLTAGNRNLLNGMRGTARNRCFRLCDRVQLPVSIPFLFFH